MGSYFTEGVRTILPGKNAFWRVLNSESTIFWGFSNKTFLIKIKFNQLNILNKVSKLKYIIIL